MALPSSRDVLGSQGLPSSRSFFTPPSRVSRAERLRRRQQRSISPALDLLNTVAGIGTMFQDLGLRAKHKKEQERFVDLMKRGHIMEAQPVRERMKMTEGEYSGFLQRTYGVSSREARAYADSLLGTGKGRRGLVSSTVLTPLELAGDVLSVPGNIFGNTLLGVRHGWQGVDPTDPWGWKQLWESTKGLSEGVTKSPWRSNSLSEYWADVAADPEAPNFLKNRVVQFGLTIATDPLMYLSFGATPLTKTAGMEVLAASNRKAAVVANKILGAQRPSPYLKGLDDLEWRGPGQVFLRGSDKELDPGDLTQLLRRAWGEPEDLLEAMHLVRNRGLARKSSELFRPRAQYKARREGRYKRAGLFSKAVVEGEKAFVPFGEAAPQGPLGAALGTGFRMITGAAAPRNVPGGAGIRFAGREIPGTPELGAKLSKGFKGFLGERALRYGGKDLEDVAEGLAVKAEPGVVRTIAKGLVPRWQLKLIADDNERAVAMAMWDHMRWRQSQIQTTVGKRIHELGVIGREGELIPGEHRANLLRTPEELVDGLDDNLKTLYSRIQVLREASNGAALKAGVTQRQLDDLWTRVVRDHQDPLGAAAEYAWRTEAKVGKHEFISDILQDPLFAKVWTKDKSPPSGFLPYRYKGRDYVVKRSVAESLENFRNGQLIDNELHRMVKLIQTPQNFWKTFATVPNPSFHVMNFLGAVWNNLGSGVYNPADYIESLAILWNARLASYAEQGRKTLTTRGVGVPSGSPLQKRALDIYESAAQRGGLGRESLFQELVSGSYSRIPGELTTKQRAREIITPHPEESKKRYAFRQARRGAAATAAVTGNVPLSAMLMMPEIAGVGRTVGTTIEDAVRLAPFVKANKQSDVWAVLDAIGPPRVPGNFNKNWTRADLESMRDVGAKLSTKFQFDYGDLTPFERSWAKTVFPFWTFYKNNLLLQAGWLANRPRFIYAAQAMENFISEQAGPLGPMEEILPAYFDNLDAFQIPLPENFRRAVGISPTDPVFLNPKLPFVTLNMIPAFWNVANTQATTPERMGLALMAPILGQVGTFAGGAPFKLLFESYTNYNFGLNQRLDYSRANSNDVAQSWVPAPKWMEYIPDPVRDFLGAIPGVKDVPVYPFAENTIRTNKDSGRLEMLATNRYVAEQLATPFITNLGRSALYAEPGHEGDKGMADLISWLTGVRLMPLDIPRIHTSLVYDQIGMLEAEKARLEGMGERLTRQDSISLRRLRRYARTLARIEDRRDREVNG